MLTPSYAITATERVLPSVSLDFTKGTLDSRITFTRTTSASNPATYINSSGTVVSATNNQARFDYDPTTLTCKGLLIEESRQNLITKSAAVGGIGWNITNIGTATCSATLNAGTAPDGTSTASRLQFNMNGGTTSGNYAFCCVIMSGMSVGTSYYDSIWLKTNDGSTVTLQMRDDIAGRYSNVITVTPTWQRFSFGGTATGSNMHACKIWIRKFVGTSDSADILAWGGQVETGAFSTSYIPTDTTSLTRNADSAIISGTNLTSWYNASQGTYSATFLKTDGYKSVGGNPIEFSNNTSGVRHGITHTAFTTSATPTYYVFDTTIQAYIDVNGAITSLPSTVTVSYKANQFNAASNKVSGPQDTAGTIPTISRCTIGSSFAGLGYYNGHIQKIKYWPQAFTTRETQAFSA